jgi:PhnB protein
MEKLTLPEGYQPITPYLILPNAGKFFDFMHTVFDAEYVYPPTVEDGKVKHGNIIVNGGQVMFSDASRGYDEQPAGLFIYVKDCDATYKKALEAGATVVTEPAEQEYGKSAGVKDPFGNTWWITSL